MLGRSLSVVLDVGCRIGCDGEFGLWLVVGWRLGLGFLFLFVFGLFCRWWFLVCAGCVVGLVLRWFGGQLGQVLEVVGGFKAAMDGVADSTVATDGRRWGCEVFAAGDSWSVFGADNIWRVHGGPRGGGASDLGCSDAAVVVDVGGNY